MYCEKERKRDWILLTKTTKDDQRKRNHENKTNPKLPLKISRQNSRQRRQEAVRLNPLSDPNLDAVNSTYKESDQLTANRMHVHELRVIKTVIN